MALLATLGALLATLRVMMRAGAPLWRARRQDCARQRRFGSGLRAWRHLGLNSVRLAPSQLDSVRLAPPLVCLHVGASSAKWRKVFIIK